jgi:hypothetical protein
MNAHPAPRSLAFSRRQPTKPALGWWALTVYNGSRPHRSLRLPLAQPQDKKVRAAHSGNGTPPYRPYLVYPGDPAHPGLPPGRCQISSLDYLPAHPGVGIKKPHGYAVFEEVATTGFEPVTKGL